MTNKSYVFFFFPSPRQQSDVLFFGWLMLLIAAGLGLVGSRLKSFGWFKITVFWLVGTISLFFGWLVDDVLKLTSAYFVFVPRRVCTNQQLRINQPINV